MMSRMTGAQRKIVWMAAAAIVLAALIVGAHQWKDFAQDTPDPSGANAPTGRMVDFACVDRSGQALRTSDLKGRFVVADFVFTSCSGMCPKLAAEMKTVQDAIADQRDVQIVSFTVDPDRDATAIRAKYADDHGFDPARWLFVRSEIGDLKKLMVDQLHLVSDTDPILHTDRFVLFDPSGEARGVYKPLEDEGWRTKLFADLGRLRAAH